MVRENNNRFSTTDVIQCSDCENIRNPCEKHLQLVIEDIGVNPGKVRNELEPEDVPRGHQRFVWTDHAKARRGHRGMGKSSCESVLREGSCYPAAGENTFRIEGQENGKNITMIVKVTPDQIENRRPHPIVTLYLKSNKN